MKKIIIPILLFLTVTLSFSCGSLGRFGYTLNEKDAAAAIRQLLEAGAKESLSSNAFSKEMVLSTLFPEPVKKVLNTLQQLGLTNEVDRFTTTLATASEKASTQSIPIFVNAIQNIRLEDAMRLVKNGGTSATDYLRSSVGDSLRRSITPVMQTALDEYKLNEQWNNIIKPVRSIAGNRLNLDLANLMAGMVSEAMFHKMAEKEKQIRSEASARSTPLLQKVFSKNWN